MEKPIETKEKMLKEFHKIMGITCGQCRRAREGYGYNIVYCDVLRMTVHANDYCSSWKERGNDEK